MLSISLSEYVACVWVLNTQDYVHNVSHRIIPDGCIDIVFDFISNVSFISGIADETANVILNGTINTMGIRFLPKAIPFILKSNASEFLNNGFETKYIVQSLQNMVEMVLGCRNVTLALKIIQNELEIYFRDFKINNRFSKILDYSLYRRGGVTVNELAAYHDISEKQLSRYFKEFVGLSTKEFLNIIRFQSIIFQMRNKKSNILHQCLDLGYYDQSHLIKDLNKYFQNTKNIY